jgi:type I restriction enzyme S subunit
LGEGLQGIPYFSPGQEERIADILSAYDDLIENNRRRIQLLEQAARLLYKEWFVHLRFPGHERVKIKDGVPEGWEKVLLSRLCYDARVSVKPRDVPGDTPYVGIEHIPRHSITLSDWSFASKVKSNKFRFEAGDILFGKIRPYFHKVGFSLTNGITSSDVIVIRPVEHSLYLYCLFLLSSDKFVGLASKTVREGSKMPRADWKFLLRFQFLLPCRVLVQAFTEFTTEIIPQLKTLALQNHQLAEARDLLLPRLMSGEIAI